MGHDQGRRGFLVTWVALWILRVDMERRLAMWRLPVLKRRVRQGRDRGQCAWRSSTWKHQPAWVGPLTLTHNSQDLPPLPPFSCLETTPFQMADGRPSSCLTLLPPTLSPPHHPALSLLPSRMSPPASCPDPCPSTFVSLFTELSPSPQPLPHG
jgi:hypothetical protein